MPYDLYLVGSGTTLTPYRRGTTPPDPDPPPDPPYEVYINNTQVALDKFGVGPSVRPYHDTAGASIGESATFDVDVSRPFLLEV